MEPLLLISDKLKAIQDNSDLSKGKGNRDGLIQQVVTYVRDGHTITRKQWVRSEFADHAKKNEEEKKKTLLNEEEREENKRRNDIADQNAKAETQDKRAKRRVEKQKEELEAKQHHSRNRKVNGDKLDAYKKKLLDKKRKLEEEERKKKQAKEKDKEEDKKKKHGAYGQKDSTRARNKQEEDMVTRPNK